MFAEFLFYSDGIRFVETVFRTGVGLKLIVAHELSCDLLLWYSCKKRAAHGGSFESQI